MAADYKTVEEFLLTLPKEEQVIVKRLRALVQECLPKATEKLNYGAPYYTNHRMICFIWPPSAYWGPKPTHDRLKNKGVSLGFCYGNLMSNDQGVLLAEGRKQVYVLYIKSLKEIDEQLIKSLLFEASLLDDSFRKGRKTGRVS
jgi:hypothetical protein